MELISDQISQLKVQNAEYEAKIDELECEVYNLKGRNEELNDDLGKSQRTVQDFSKQFSYKYASNRASTSNDVHFTDTYNKLSNEITVLRSEIHNLRSPRFEKSSMDS